MTNLLIDTPNTTLPAIVEALRPIHDRVLVRVLPEEPRLDGLVLVRDDPQSIDAVNEGTGDHSDYRRVPLMGEIIAVGPGRWHRPEHGKEFFKATIVKPGELVIFTNWNDWEAAPEGFAMITEGDIWGYPAPKQSCATTKRKPTKR